MRLAPRLTARGSPAITVLKRNWLAAQDTATRRHLFSHFVHARPHLARLGRPFPRTSAQSEGSTQSNGIAGDDLGVKSLIISSFYKASVTRISMSIFLTTFALNHH